MFLKLFKKHIVLFLKYTFTQTHTHAHANGQITIFLSHFIIDLFTVNKMNS